MRETFAWMVYNPWLYGVAMKNYFFKGDTKLSLDEEEAIKWLVIFFAIPFFVVTVVVALFYQVESSSTFYMFVASCAAGVLFTGVTSIVGDIIEVRSIEKVFEGSGVAVELISLPKSQSWGILLEITNFIVNLGLGVCFGVMLKSLFLGLF